ncbi:helix-turn-helix domain-containing protein [Terrilactibacillus sp. S3-3]|nr:helix-turn-helix domain-containing protein [Terrilactibacillus sp. S3-3]
MAEADVITKELLPDDFAKNVGAGSAARAVPTASGPGTFTVESEKEKIERALEKTYGNKSAAAKLLGISRVTLYHRLKKYNLPADELIRKKSDT